MVRSARTPPSSRQVLVDGERDEFERNVMDVLLLTSAHAPAIPSAKSTLVGVAPVLEQMSVLAVGEASWSEGVEWHRPSSRRCTPGTGQYLRRTLSSSKKDRRASAAPPMQTTVAGQLWKALEFAASEPDAARRHLTPRGSHVCSASTRCRTSYRGPRSLAAAGFNSYRHASSMGAAAPSGVEPIRNANPALATPTTNTTISAVVRGRRGFALTYTGQVSVAEILARLVRKDEVCGVVSGETCRRAAVMSWSIHVRPGRPRSRPRGALEREGIFVETNLDPGPHAFARDTSPAGTSSDNPAILTIHQKCHPDVLGETTSSLAKHKVGHDNSAVGLLCHQSILPSE